MPAGGQPPAPAASGTSTARAAPPPARETAGAAAIPVASGSLTPGADTEPAPEAPVRLVAGARTDLGLAGVSGLSDLTRDDRGRLWAVAERKRVAVEVTDPPRAITLVGVPPGLDTEGIAWLGKGRFALSTEADGPRTADPVLVAERRGNRLQVVASHPLEYRAWPLSPTPNQGIEGICRAGDRVVLAVETVREDGHARYAPVAVMDLATGSVAPFWVRLTSAHGKLSAVSCMHRRAAGGHPARIDVLAIERHFGVARLVRFALPGRPAPGHPPVTVAARVIADLLPLEGANHENFEGLVWDGGRNVALVVDNDWKTITGPNLLLEGRLSGAPPTAPEPAPPARSGPATARTRH